ncbi:MAG TPA: CPBP family intramembrane glutamic endopeptidase [Candidatus Polarisedimenticolaceae bacterium]|nr:CPBP family intramembrane glutamic endopeptidase [Candidatus Polarisedimenticolaceae bacterium]
MNVSPSGWVFLLLMCVWVPLLAVRSALRVRQAASPPTRTQHVTSVFVSQALMLLVALMAARNDWIELFPRATPGLLDLALFVGFLVPTLGSLPGRWNWKPAEEKRRTLWMLPHSTRDLWWWALVSLVAGVVEEIAYRGVMVTLLQRILGSWGLAVAICVLVFTLAHYVQGWRALVAIVVFTTAVHWIVRLTGNLYTAMAVHMVYDFLAGVILVRLAKRDGLVPTVAGS